MTELRVELHKVPRAPTNGPLKTSKKNPCYFFDRAGRPVYLTGSHDWSNFQEIFSDDPDAELDFPKYLDWLVERNHNFIRGWHWEQTSWTQFAGDRTPVRPMPFLRTGPGNALDGSPRFDCTRFDEVFFSRMRQRLQLAAERGFYVSVMLFQGWSTDNRRPALHCPLPVF